MFGTVPAVTDRFSQDLILVSDAPWDLSIRIISRPDLSGGSPDAELPFEGAHRKLVFLFRLRTAGVRAEAAVTVVDIEVFLPALFQFVAVPGVRQIFEGEIVEGEGEFPRHRQRAAALRQSQWLPVSCGTS